MVQWSPDTTPRADLAGYKYRDNHITGFSLTHLSGAGCSLYGDFPFLPTTEPIDSSPAVRGDASTANSSRASPTRTSGRPGYYSVRLNPVHGGAIDNRADRDDANRDGALHLPARTRTPAS